MPGSHEVAAAVVTGPHQVTGSFLAGGGDPHCGDLSKMEQSGQMSGVAGIGLDPVPSRTDQLRWRRGQRAGQAEPGRAGLICHRRRARNLTKPGHDLRVIGSQPSLKHLTGVSVQGARDDRSRVHIQANTRTLNLHWGLPHLAALPARTSFLSATHVHM